MATSCLVQRHISCPCLAYLCASIHCLGSGQNHPCFSASAALTGCQSHAAVARAVRSISADAVAKHSSLQEIQRALTQFVIFLPITGWWRRLCDEQTTIAMDRGSRRDRYHGSLCDYHDSGKPLRQLEVCGDYPTKRESEVWPCGQATSPLFPHHLLPQ